MRALITHRDFYKAAVADCGCHDNRMDKIWWNELWMGWSVIPHYAEQSTVTQAHRVKGKPFLIVGETDENDPAGPRPCRRWTGAGGQGLWLLVIPGHGHGTGFSGYGRRRMQDSSCGTCWGGARGLTIDDFRFQPTTDNEATK